MYFSFSATTSLERFFIFWRKNSLMDLLKDNHTQPLKTFPGTFSSAKEYNNNKKKANKKSKWNLWDAFCRNLLFRIYSPGWFCCLYGLGVCGCAQKFFLFCFLLFFLPVDLWMDRRDWQDQKKKENTFFCLWVWERGGGEWIEANANPLLVCHYIVTFLYLQQSSGSFSRLIYWFFLHLFFWMVPILWNSFI